jgi:hypothetical protein
MHFCPDLHKPHPKRKFSQAEDVILSQLVEEHGTGDWMTISRKMVGRKARQCRERWDNYLSPDVRNGPWTMEEEKQLLDLYDSMGAKWKQIATFFNARTEINVKSRWQLIQRRRLRGSGVRIDGLPREERKGRQNDPTISQVKDGYDTQENNLSGIWGSMAYGEAEDLNMVEDFWYEHPK